MHFRKTQLADVWLIEPSPHQDDRGRFMRAWCTREFTEQGIQFLPVQANMGFSVGKGTIRGMHYQVAPAPEAKLVRCTRGSAFDVAIDLRPGSASYGKWFGEELSAENGRMLYVPEYCAHGFQSLEDRTEVLYMTSAFYNPGAVRGARFDDPAFNIHWPLAAMVVSEQDRNWPLFDKSLPGKTPGKNDQQQISGPEMSGQDMAKVKA
jgi:dTDP-4-dehydrorhamnose 3,5-epimerase